MNYIKHQITENSCEYIAFNFEGPDPCAALFVDISTYGTYEIRLGVYFGQHDGETVIDEAEFTAAFDKAASSFPNYLECAKTGRMSTIAEMHAMPLEERAKYIQYPGWSPYCLMCDFRERMAPMSFGWVCPQCGNHIGHHCKRLQESPLNRPGYSTPGMYPIPNR